MVFPKINHGFLSADQQLIKRRLIKSQWIQQYHTIMMLECVTLPHREIRGKQDHLGLQGHQVLLGQEGLQGTQAKMGPEVYLVSQDLRGHKG
ncbi:hypothetical protein INR49_011772 [Caranx melampygus]|nr:hypothetical protein INR49_011772 [Caranx melampygus]